MRRGHSNKLNARLVESAGAGKHSDGAGLYLIIGPGTARRWAFIFPWREKGKRKLKEMGLGSARSDSTKPVSLARARELAGECRMILAQGRDPIEARKAASAAQATAPKFGAFADNWIETMEAGWRNAKHRYQWRATFRPAHADDPEIVAGHAASLRNKSLDAIGTEDVLAILKPIWLDMPETAARVRARIERILDAARAAGHRSEENPARWKGHLAQLLPRRQRLTRGHHPAMPFADVPAFIERLRERPAIAALALELIVLTAARSGEVLGARWSEIDMKAKVWTIPGSRMKRGVEHRVPLVPRAIEILEEMAKVARGELVFPAHRADRPMSDMACSMLLRRMKVEGVTVHGFRSSFRDWAGELTSFPREVAEAALAHAVGNAVEQAYRRGDALEKRRMLMDVWGSYCEKSGEDKVVRLRALPDGG